MKFIKYIISLFIFTIRGFLFSVTLHVPQDFLTIQSAINASQDSDTIQVAPGTYYENISYTSKDIVIVSEYGPEVTIIDGENNGSVVTFSGGESELAGLIGFQIQNGTGTYISFLDYGGGILVKSATPRLENLIVHSNSAFAGGGIAYHSTEPTNFTPSLKNCLIQNNYGSEGGGIFCANISPIIENTQIISNGFDLNGSGGGINSMLAFPVLKNVEVSGNDSKWGGGIYCTSGGLTLENVEISTNSTIMHGAGLWFGLNSYLNGHNVLIKDNYADSFGGGAWIINSQNVEITNFTIVENMALNAGGIYISNSEVMVLNSIIWDNFPQAALLTSDPGDLYIAYSNIENGISGIENEIGEVYYENGNIAENPQLNENYELSESSPCIDTGTPNYTFENNYNISIDTNFNGSAPDIGAYESDYNILIGDVNGDALVNVVDVVLIVNAILGETEMTDEFVSLADLNFDNNVNVSDIVILIGIILNS